MGDANRIECPDCGRTFSILGSHLVRSDTCTFPDFSEEQLEILTGLLMGDGSLDTSNQNPSLVVDMVQKEFLEWLNKLFPINSRKVYLAKSAEEQRDSLEKGLGRDIEEAKDLFRWRTISSPNLVILDEWYKDGDKLFPDGVELSPNLLKMWYVCDGTFMNYSDGFGLRIYNHTQDEEKLESYFGDIGIEATNNSTVKGLSFDVPNSKRFIDYIGDSVPGFEYKWPDKE